MRAIKFRVWWEGYNSKMIYDVGIYNVIKVHEGATLERRPTCVNDIFLSNKERDKIYNCLENTVKVTWMQYTGLKDKNGQEIYEGDILNVQYHNLGVEPGLGAVEFDIGWDSDGYLHEQWLGWKCGSSSLIDVNQEGTIIGNIYENPELLNE